MQAIGFLASGFNFSQRAPSFGVDRSTVSHWCHKYQETHSLAELQDTDISCYSITLRNLKQHDTTLCA